MSDLIIETPCGSIICPCSGGSLSGSIGSIGSIYSPYGFGSCPGNFIRGSFPGFSGSGGVITSVTNVCPIIGSGSESGGITGIRVEYTAYDSLTGEIIEVWCEDNPTNCCEEGSGSGSEPGSEPGSASGSGSGSPPGPPIQTPCCNNAVPSVLYVNVTGCPCIGLGVMQMNYFPTGTGGPGWYTGVYPCNGQALWFELHCIGGFNFWVFAQVCNGIARPNVGGAAQSCSPFFLNGPNIVSSGDVCCPTTPITFTITE